MRKLSLAIAAASMTVPVAFAPPAMAGGYYDRGDDGYYRGRVWRGRDGRMRCRRRDGTTGLIIGGAAGALIGRSIDGGRSRATGTILGAAAGALLGREVDKSRGFRCR